MRYLVKSPVRHAGQSWPVGSVVDIDERDAALAVKRGRLVPAPEQPPERQPPGVNAPTNREPAPRRPKHKPNK